MASLGSFSFFQVQQPCSVTSEDFDEPSASFVTTAEIVVELDRGQPGSSAVADVAATVSAHVTPVHVLEASQRTHNDASEEQTTHVKFLSWWLSGASVEHDEAMYGLRCATDAGSENCSEDKKMVIMDTVKRLPTHLLRETLTCILPTFSGIIVMLVGAFVHRMCIRNLAGFTDSIGSAEPRIFEKGMIGEALLFQIPSVMTEANLVSFSVLMIMPFGMWKHVHVLQRYYFPFQCLLLACKTGLMLWRPSQFRTILSCYLFACLITSVVIMFFPFRSVGRKTGNPFLAPIILGTNVAILAASQIFYYVKPFVVNSSDFTRLALIVLVFPLAFHGLLCSFCRVSARAFRNIDPSTLWLYTSISAVFERTMSRLIMSILAHPFNIVIAVLLKGIVTALLDQLYGGGDNRFYSLSGRLSGVSSPLQNVHCPQLNLFSERYKVFRPLYMSTIFAYDVALITAFSCLLLAYNVGRADGQLFTVDVVAARFAVQIVCEYLRHVCTIFVFVYQSKTDFITLAECKCQHWTVCLTIPIARAVISLITSHVLGILCVAPSGNEATFLLCSPL
eukprot:TRINITY_DN24032_c0_g1_i1.p1 TRINITY_DN24032_c0_g1~~TRINITY_DN24032_c0_g1_i1.p1  ORF type:complete len:563 (-),score=33.93 TRINITY_DN24032_c0_g1_i1:28-1716(-)